MAPDTNCNLCVICMEQPVEIVLYKCGHACMCNECVKQIRKESQRCPICRQIFLDAVKFYK